jgi:hypothetical protein
MNSAAPKLERQRLDGGTVVRFTGQDDGFSTLYLTDFRFEVKDFSRSAAQVSAGLERLQEIARVAVGFGRQPETRSARALKPFALCPETPTAPATV